MTVVAMCSKKDDVLHLSGAICSGHVRATIKFLLNLGDRRGTIIITSHGGDEYEGFALYDLLRPYGQQLTAVALGQVQSAAVLPFLACDRRLTGPGTAFMFHHGTYELPTPEHQREVMNIARELEFMDERYMSVIVGRTKIGRKAVRRLTRFGHYFDSAEALRNGFATGVLGRIKR